MDLIDKQLQDLAEIREIMERSRVYNSLSGLSGVAAGVIAIFSYLISYIYTDSFIEHQADLSIKDGALNSLIQFYFGLSTIALFLTFLAIFYFNSRKAKRLSHEFMDIAMRRMFINLFIPLITGGVFCIVLLNEKNYLMIPAAMLIFYGLAMVNASKYTLEEIRHLGVTEVVIGLIAAFNKEYSLWFWLAGFGLMNLIYGAYIYFKYERQ